MTRDPHPRRDRSPGPLRLLGEIGLSLGIVFVVASLTLTLACKRAPRPNVILITVDTLRADHLSPYGYAAAKTPTLAKLAQKGITFTQATTPLPRTTPALVSLMTGLWPHHHGSREVGTPPRQGYPLAEILRTEGYTTAGVTANRAAGRFQKFNAGFERFEDYRDIPDESAKSLTDRALALSQESTSNVPLFLWVHYLDPHAPYGAPPDWPQQLKAPKCRALQEAARSDTLSLGQIYSDATGASSEALEECISLYDNSISYADHHIGRLLTGLDSLGRMDDTIVIVTSDHGELLGERGIYYEHGPSVHDANLKVPLIIAGPGLKSGVTEGEVIRLEDLSPTLLGLLNIGQSLIPDMDGVDLSSRLRSEHKGPVIQPPMAYAESGGALQPGFLPALSTGTKSDRHCIHLERYSYCQEDGKPSNFYDNDQDPSLLHPLEEIPPEVEARLKLAARSWPPESARERTVRTNTLKLVARPTPEGAYAYALYDLRADPLELKDLSGSRPKELRDLKQHLDAWVQTLPEAPRRPGRTSEEESALKALGYIE